VRKIAVHNNIRIQINIGTNKKRIDAKHQRATPKEFDPGLHLNT
jgi:hypothetical protein